MIRKQLAANNFTITIAAAVVVMLYGLLVFLPNQKAINQLRKKRACDERSIIEADLLAMAIRAKEDQALAADAIMRHWKESARNLSGARFYDALTRAAGDSGLELVELVPGITRSLQATRQTPLKLKARGTISAVHAFIHKVEALPVKAWCLDLVLAPCVASPALPGQLDCQIDLLVFEAGANFSDQADVVASR